MQKTRTQRLIRIRIIIVGHHTKGGGNMHRTIRKLLEDATGVSEFVIALNIDIRGFSSFSKKVESPDAAMFIKRVYRNMIDSYFSQASFFKPTGDGLLITIPYEEKQLEEIAQTTIASCERLLTDFGSFTTNDPMINFDVPRRVGIGISRGTACRLVSKGKTLDYSGRVLNLASRLMDLARPSGIVFDKDFGIELLSNNQVKVFASEQVYLKGIAEREPVEIWYLKGQTKISPLSKQPIDAPKWHVDMLNYTLKRIKELGPNYVHELTSIPLDPTDIRVKITHPMVLRGRKYSDFLSFFNFPNFEYILEAGKPNLSISFDALIKRLESNGVKPSWEVEIEIMFQRTDRR
jgi:class 3 adenylate cyclase